MSKKIKLMSFFSLLIPIYGHASNYYDESRITNLKAEHKIYKFKYKPNVPEIQKINRDVLFSGNQEHDRGMAMLFGFGVLPNTKIQREYNAILKRLIVSSRLRGDVNNIEIFLSPNNFVPSYTTRSGIINYFFGDIINLYAEDRIAFMIARDVAQMILQKYNYDRLIHNKLPFLNPNYELKNKNDKKAVKTLYKKIKDSYIKIDNGSYPEVDYLAIDLIVNAGYSTRFLEAGDFSQISSHPELVRAYIHKYYPDTVSLKERKPSDMLNYWNSELIIESTKTILKPDFSDKLYEVAPANRLVSKIGEFYSAPLYLAATRECYSGNKKKCDVYRKDAVRSARPSISAYILNFQMDSNEKNPYKFKNLVRSVDYINDVYYTKLLFSSLLSSYNKKDKEYKEIKELCLNKLSEDICERR